MPEHSGAPVVVTDPADLSTWADRARAGGATVGLVPTMGDLHAGHRALVARARAECDAVAVSVFVNPTQFGDPADLDRYPRRLDADVAAAGESGADLVFSPSAAAMYPEGFATTVHVGGLGDVWEGASRPGHFDGVATVVAKLFALTGRCRAYFGDKDFQQQAAVRRLVADLGLPVQVVGCPTVRDADGLALSSRNARLDPAQRAAAPALHRALVAGAAAVAAGATDPEDVGRVMAGVVTAEPALRLDYAAAIDPVILAPARPVDTGSRLVVAAWAGPTRLIDNLPAGAGDAGTDQSVAPSHHRNTTRATTVTSASTSRSHHGVSEACSTSP